MEDAITDDVNPLEIVWSKFCTEPDKEQKAYWANLFLFQYQQHPDVSSLQFISSVPSELSCYLLQQIYDIICTTVPERLTTDNGNGAEFSAEQSENYDASSLTEFQSCAVNPSSDISAIVPLREFLTRGLGRALLEFLRNCDVMLISCKRELACLLHNLFPSSSWNNEHAEQFKPVEPASFQEYADSLHLMQKLKFKPTIDVTPASDFATIRNVSNKLKSYDQKDFDDSIKYDLDQFECFQKRQISSDLLAFIIIDILMELVRSETNEKLSEKSITLESFKFGLDTLNSLHRSTSFDLMNREILKFKLLSLIFSCLNNFFGVEKNVDLIDVKNVLKQLILLIRNGCAKDVSANIENEIEQYQISSSMLIVYLLFGFINNIFVLSRHKREEAIELSDVFNDNEIHYFINDLQTLLAYLSDLQSNDLNQIVELIFIVIREKKAKRRVRKQVNCREIDSNQIHCKGRTFSCIMEKILLTTAFNPRLQCLIINKFLKNSICCCSYNIETVDVIISRIKNEEIARFLYKFLRKRIWKSLFGKANCSLCQTTSRSSDFIGNLIHAYEENFKSITEECQRIKFLEHLFKIGYISTELSKRMLSSIVLPTLYVEINKDCKNRQLQAILICLKITINYLIDPKLVKIYFVNENITQLKTLINTPELVDVVCALLKIGLNNFNDIGTSAEEQTLLNKQLMDILLTTNVNSTKLLNSMLIISIKANLEENPLQTIESLENNEIYNLLSCDILDISQVLYLTAAYWELTIDLCCLHSQFKLEFYRSYALQNEKHFNKLLDFTANILSCFLLPAFSNRDMFDNSSLTMWNITNDFCIITPDEIRGADNYLLSAADIKTNLEEDTDQEQMRNIGNLWSSSIDAVDRRAPLYVEDSSDLSHQSFEEITQSMSWNENFQNEFLNVLKASDSDFIFDIKNQTRYSNLLTNWKTESKRFLGSFSSLIATIFGAEENDKKIKSADMRVVDQNRILNSISVEKLKCLQTSAYCKSKLLNIFVSSLATLALDINLPNEKNMQLLLRQLRNLLLPYSRNIWSNVENANAIIQALHAILKVAEMMNNAGVNDGKLSVLRTYTHCSDIKSGVYNSSENQDNLSGPNYDQIESEVDISENEFDDDEHHITGDEGYEADAEVLGLSDSSDCDKDLFNRYTPSSKYRTHAVNEGLCGIVVEILMALSTQCISNPEFWSNSLSQLASRLYIIRDSLGGSLFLLKGFASVLTKNDSRLKEFQQSILDLIMDIDDPDALAAYFNILAAEDPPIELIVQYLTHICNSSINLKPTAALVFPMKNDDSTSFTCNKNIFDTINQIRSLHANRQSDSAFDRSACILPIPQNMKPWTEDGFTISTWIELKGVSNNCKTSTENLTNQNSYEDTHIISFGSDQLIMSVYINKTYNLVFEFNHPSADINSTVEPREPLNEDNASNYVYRRKRKLQKKVSSNNVDGVATEKYSAENKQEINEGKSVLKQVLHSTRAILNSFSHFHLFLSPNESDNVLYGARIESESIVLPKNKWTHLCIAVHVEGKSLNIAVIINGSNLYNFNDLPWNGLHSTIKSKNFKVVCIGETYRNEDAKNLKIEYNLSSVLIFKKYFNSRSTLANLTAFGPDCNHLTYCQAANNVPNYGFLNYNFFWNYDIENINESLKALRSHLILAYSANDPKYFIHYLIVEDLVSIGKKEGLISFVSDLVSKKIPSISNATYICGGLSCLLYLFARTVELTTNSDIQAKALNILLRVALTDSKLYTEFVKRDFLSLIGSVIKTDRCSKGVHLLKTIVNSACNLPVFVQRNGDIYLIENSNACVVHPNLIISIVRRYSDWSRSGTTDSIVLDMLLQCIQDLVREKQPHQSYNISQFSKSGFIKELLNLCKIYVVESPNPIYLSTQSATLFVNILNIFAGAPPSPSLLDEITKLLLILQKPNECYVTDNRSRFYFLVTSEIPTRQRRIGLPLPSKQIRLSLRHRKKNQSMSSDSPEKKLTKSESFTNTKYRFFIHDLDTLRSIANCSPLNERKLCAVKQENNERFRKFLINLKKQQLQQSQQHKNQMRKVAKNKTRKISVPDCSNKKMNVAPSGSVNPSQAELMTANEYDIVNSDEISSLEGRKSFRKFARPDVYNSPGVVGIQNGLFNLLKDFLLILPDSSVDEVLSHYVKLEIILVLANHKNCNVRTSIVQLLMILCDRLVPSELQLATKKMYWFHLGNQLALYPADDRLVEACIQWVTRKPTFSIHFEKLNGQELKIGNLIGLNALFAIAPQTVHSNNLAVSTFKVIEHIYKTNIDHNIYMIENGLIQSVVRTLQKIYLELNAEYEKVEAILKSLLTSIAEKSLYSNGHINILWDLLNILSHYKDSKFSNVVAGFRSVQANILITLLQTFLRQNAQLGLNIKFKDIYLQGSNLSASETRTRFDLLIDRSIQFFISVNDSYNPCPTEQKLFEQMISLSLAGNIRCSNLIAWGLSPNRVSSFKTYIINTLISLFEQSAFPSIVCDWKMIKSFLRHDQSSENNDESCSVFKLCKMLRVTDNDSWLAESLDKLELNRDNCLSEQKPMIEKALYKFETTAQSCIDFAMSITRIVADLQNAERKHLMGLMRQYDDNVIYAEWKLIIQRMTHEGAPWYCSAGYPKSWELDDTEGPSRVRTRLRRCNLDIDTKFIMPDYREAYLARRCKRQPLEYLISSHDQQINFSLNAQILFNFPAKYLPVDGEIEGELIVTDEKIFFAATHRCKFFYINSFIENITEIWIRRYQHQEKAFEFFVNSNKSFFFVVENSEDRKMLKEIFSDKIVGSSEPMKLMQQWKDGRLTNWEYLMALNQISGRTYNDLMQYPVFPWILSDYKTNCLDLTQKSSYRKLEKPIAVQHDENEQHYINNYAYINSSMSSLGTWNMKPYHYSSHYSNSGTVLHFLVRVPLFTKFFLNYQDNNFDIPDRTFHSLNTTWSLASKDSPTDVKELIPEFFCLPEIFENIECFNFGARQSGEIVNHVSLPAWCSNNARLFVLIHRQALESEMVRKNLHHWIDLIFGYKQTGTAAVNAINVFHPATYSEFDFADIADPIEKQAFQTMIKTYGQMPRQLFKTAHDGSNELNYSSHQPSVITSVKGLRWGVYTGSPQLEDPKICNVYKNVDSPFSTLISFGSKNMIYGLSMKTCIMLGTESDYNLVSWNHDDSIVRIHSLNDSISSSKPLVYNDPVDEISACGSYFNSNVLWFGHKSGKLTVYHCTNHESGKNNRNRSTNSGIKLSYNSAFRMISSKLPSRLEEYESLKDNRTCKYDLGTVHWSGPTNLIRHTDEVTDICISTEFKIAVSIAKDGLAVIWDTNSLNYIRTIERPSELRHSPLNIVKISPTLGDIFTVHSIEISDNEKIPTEVEEECFEVTEENLDDFVNISMNFNGKSIMRLHSVNAKYVNHTVQEDRILSACYSSIKEGIGVNVIATGFEGGIVKLWSSWDLSLIKEIIVSQSDIISVTFSTYQHLVVLTKDDYIQVWESNGLHGEPPKFPQIMFHKGSN